MYDINRVRKDFPILSKVIYDKYPLVYLDNAATTQKPRCVVDAMTDEYFNVTSTAIITVPKGCCYTVSVENASFGATAADPATAINVQNANVVVSRIA